MPSPRKLALVLLIGVSSVHAQKVVEPTSINPEWIKLYAPFRVVGNLYYVGTYDLACYLITTSEGNILINTGLASSAAVIKSNIESLGFKFSDTKILLTTQAHYDHVGAMAEIKKQTGARLFVNEKDAGVIRDGGKSDYAFGGNSTFEPVVPDRLLKDKEVIELGGAKLTLLHHPGHTKGSSSYALTVKDDQKSWRVVIVNMPSIVVNKKFSEISAYPEIAEDYGYTFYALKNLVFDLWLSSHASQFGLHEKHKPGDSYNPSAFSDRSGYDATLAELKSVFDQKLKAE